MSFHENSRPCRKAAEQRETDEDGRKVLRQSQGFLVSTISKDGQAINLGDIQLASFGNRFSFILKFKRILDSFQIIDLKNP